MRNDREILYQALQMADEQRKRRNFDAFMTGLEIGLIDDLNKAYASGDMEKYDRLKKNIKEKTGAKIFRNSEGKHKISFI